MELLQNQAEKLMELKKFVGPGQNLESFNRTSQSKNKFG
jgi:hypothetical protein